MTDPTHVVLKSGIIVQPRTGLRAQTDLEIIDGRISSIGPADRSEAREIALDGAQVWPGLVDLHSHIHDGVLYAAIPADESALRRGVVLVTDAGSVGAAGFRGFINFVVEPSAVRVASFLNVSSVGIIDVRVSEFADPAALNQDAVRVVAREHPDVVRGLKVRLSQKIAGGTPLKFLRAAVELGAELVLPVMVHVGATSCTLAEILRELRPGDIVTHCYHGHEEGIVQDGHVIDAALDARDRGVIFDVGHGTTQFSYEVAQRAIASGFAPDVISSDLSRRNWYGPAYDLLSVVSKMIELGMDELDAVRAATYTPAGILGIPGYGSSSEGELAHLTVVKRLEEPDIMRDGHGRELAVHRYEPTHVYLAGILIEPVTWRGLSGIH